MGDQKRNFSVRGLSMKYKEFAKYVGHLLSKDFGVDKVQLLHATMGLVTESAEVLDLLKKHYAYGRPLNINKVKNELADVFHYLTMANNMLGIGIEDLMNINKAKLDIRYPDGYTNEKANNRDTEAEQKAVSNLSMLCSTCRYGTRSAEKSPCNQCYGGMSHPEWESKIVSQKGISDATK